MHTCSVHKKLEIVPGGLNDYERLAAYHYRDGSLAAVKSVFLLRPNKLFGTMGSRSAGVIVYAMPNPRVELRNLATGDIFSGLDRQTELSLINHNVRLISRVIIEPRFRGIGLASRLVRETMPMMKTPIVEALGVMPLVNPFLERAGMTAFRPRAATHHVELIEAFGAVGIEEERLIDPEAVQEALDALDGPAEDFIEAHIQRFLKSHGSRRTMSPGPGRTRYILGKLTHRPAYYIWLNPDLEVSTP